MRRRLPETLRGRLAAAAALAAGIALVAVGVVLLALYERSEHRALDDQLVEQAERVERPARAALALGLDRALERINPRLVRQVLGGGDSLRVLDGSRVIAAAGDQRGDALPPPTGEGFAEATASGLRWRTYTRDLGAGRRLTLAAPIAPMRTRVHRARWTVLAVVASGVAGVAALAWWIAGLALAPLTQLRAGAARVSGTSDLRERLPVAGDGPDEVRALAGSLNAMLARLEGSAARTEAALRAARTFTADAGHELRTPLTALRANVDTLARNPELPGDERARLLADIEADQRRMAALLDGLQALARGDAGVPGTRAPVELSDLAASAVSAARRRHPTVTWELDAEPAVVDGLPDGLRMLLDNLLENAARHGRPGGRVRVSVGGDGIVVDDDGPGIVPGERERVFARFARGPGTRVNGSGLGLAIVAQQAALHGGRARAEESPLGGARIVVELEGR